MARSKPPLRVRILRLLLAVAVVASGVTPAVVTAAAPAHAAVALNDSEVTANLWEWNWNSVAAACTNHLGPAGYGAVQVAPPQESVSLPNSADGVHPWYEVYQPVSYKLESRFGNRQQFAAMVTACHGAGVRVYVDAVVNHMAGVNNAPGTVGYAGTTFTGYDYPAVPYGNGDFHRPGDNCPTSGGINDWNNESQVTSCELLALSDLYTEKEQVRNKIAAFLNDLIGLGVDGFRVDAIKHVKKADFAAILSKLNNTVAENRRPYVAQEIFDGASNDALKARAFIGNGDVLDFAYAKGLRSSFQGSIANLANIGSWNLDAPSANVFAMVTNHDLERDGVVLSYKNGTDYTLANYFALAYPHGKPSVYDSFTWSNRNQSPPATGSGHVTDTACGGNWTCLTQSTGIKGMVGWANTARAVKSISDFTVVNSNVIGFHRGDRGWIGINDSGSASTAQFVTGLADGAYCDVISGAATAAGCTGTTVTVTGGRASVTIPANGAVALHANARGGPAVKIATTFTATAPLPADRTLHLVGNTPALGNGDPATSVPLTRNADGTWTATVDLPAATAISYRYLAKSGTTVVEQEAVSRTFTTPAGGTATRIDTYVPGPVGDTVATTFTVTATVTAGQEVYVVGSVPELGTWAPASAVRLPAEGGVFRGVVDLPKSAAVEYKFIKKTAAGGVTWESGANRALTTPAGGSHTVTETFRGDTAGPVAVSFHATATTNYGQNVYVVGNLPALGGWNPANAVALSPADYPIWRATVSLPPNTSVEYKYLKKNPDGSVTWESGGNRTFTTPAGGTNPRTDTWR
ncbi:carbohydrate-binding module family 20 domain-containing protein [Micromonospora peucetia]|uniref:Alpha-amylase n=1 Tax=Micromonospora peucetia TaxID=47871 RepID=A0A1C6W0W5_9ACTN|nr:carbohydrate-binding module family 20 domain-containing protein [Micromonospora peucetia]WSA31814.1 alpha-amylase family glycosyl hydrolase [Micromonospora peucetia]SCL72117.1 alpha-amylase [Micromonospora peucetia]